MQEFEFDKFMDDIVKREDNFRDRIKEYAENHADTPQRRYNAKYREHAHNRIKYDREQ
jgi:hypothetical protein